MLHTDAEATTLGLGQDVYFNWHKSLGLVALLVVIFRLLNRSVGQLPPWAPTLIPVEKMVVHRAEQMLYCAMFLMPLSGFLYVMAANYGVLLFRVYGIPNPIGTQPAIAALAKWVHISIAFLLLLPLGAHLCIVLSHHYGLGDGMIGRMLPGRVKRRDG